MTPDKNYAVRLKFQYKLGDNLEGFYMSRYKDKGGNTRYIKDRRGCEREKLTSYFRRLLATSHFEPTYARRAFPCFDEPELKAKFLMTITHDRALRAFFNMPKKGSSEVRNKPDLVRDEFEETVEMSTYLVAFVVCDFATIDKVIQTHNLPSCQASSNNCNSKP